jgi:hypothetical protein
VRVRLTEKEFQELERARRSAKRWQRVRETVDVVFGCAVGITLCALALALCVGVVWVFFVVARLGWESGAP